MRLVNPKKILTFLLALCAILALASCDGTLIEGVPNGGGEHREDTSQKEEDTMPPVGELDDDPSNDFTVTLTADGQPYSPRIDDMYVYWTDGFSKHAALVDENGVARIDGLDGDYRVTLSEVPNEYTYNPNGYTATNDDRNLTLELYSLNRLTGKGDNVYSPRRFTKTGVYSVELDGPDDAIYFCYAPDGSGTYSIESWVDVTKDAVNPYVEVYHGSFAWVDVENSFTIEDGGPVGSYTSNFVYHVQIADQNISDSGQAVYTFALKADSKTGQYPVTVTFAVKYNGTFELEIPGRVTGVAVPKYDFSKFELSEHEYGTAAKPAYYQSGGTKIFDENRFKLYPASEGGDDFYHLYDEEKYASNGGYGPILYAYITKTIPEFQTFIDSAFIDMDNIEETRPSSRIAVGGIDYKHFIEGYSRLSARDYVNGSSYYCAPTCPCHITENPETGWACPPTCQDCSPSCRRCPAELIGNEGYQSMANSDGLVPVTKELRDFLQSYVFERRFFYDGIGWMEGYGYQAIGESGWLMACAYYE